MKVDKESLTIKHLVLSDLALPSHLMNGAEADTRVDAEDFIHNVAEIVAGAKKLVLEYDLFPVINREACEAAFKLGFHLGSHVRQLIYVLGQVVDAVIDEQSGCHGCRKHECETLIDDVLILS